MSWSAGSRRIATTRWSLVLAAADSASPEARAALAFLCETYWAPVYHFVRSSGRPAEDARDLTQAFFARVLEKEDFKSVRRDRGRFRTFLLTAVRHFLANQVEHDRALKRGGSHVHVSLEPGSNDDPTAFQPPASLETPETIYEQRWALATLDSAMARLAREHEERGRMALFTQLQPFLAGESTASFAAVAGQFGMEESSVRVALHRLRQQFGKCLRATLAETVDDPADVDAELQYLMTVINRRRPAGTLEQS